MSYDLRFAHVIDATPERVFDALTQPGGQEAFYGTDDPGWIVESDCDLRVDGVWTIAFGRSRSELYRHAHVFRLIERPHRLLLDTTEADSTDRRSSSRPSSYSNRKPARP